MEPAPRPAGREVPAHLREALAEANAAADVQVLVDPSPEVLEAYALEGKVGVVALVTGGPERRAAALLAGALEVLDPALPEVEARARVEAAVARFRSRLHMEQAREALDAQVESREIDLRLAAQLQRSLLPERLPNPPGWELAVALLPREFVCGDMYEARLLGPDHLLVWTLDAVGHGVCSALLGVLLRTALAPLDPAGRPRPPGEVLSELDRRLCDARLGGSPTAAFCYVLLELSSGRVWLANAGHPIPWRQRPPGAGGPELEPLGDSGLLLGVDPAPRPTLETRLEAGERLFLFTDGIGADLGQRFGRELSVHRDLGLMDQIGGALGASVQLDAEGAPEDDVTVLGVRRQAKLPAP